MPLQNICTWTALAALAVATTATTTVTADTETLGALQDATLYETEEDSTDYLANGAGRYCFAGRTNQGEGQDQRRTVMSFDVAGNDIPAGSTITGVTLTLYMSRTNTSNRVVSLRRLTADWSEGSSNPGGQEGAGDSAGSGDTTWIHRDFPGTLWSSPGGDFEGGAPASSTTVGDQGYYTWSSATMVQHVQQWLDNPSGNFGWILIGDESTSQTAKRFNTREDNDADTHPMLEIQFNAPVSTGACCLVNVCMELSQSDCNSQGGTYLGDGVPCLPNPCVQSVGACCFADGTCQILTSGDCTAAGGAYGGDGTVCTPNPCPQPTGACCFPDGSCTVLTDAACTMVGGTFQGNFTSCTPNPCPQPFGACCFDDATCMDATLLDCASMGGTFQGNGSFCELNTCPLPLEPFVDPLPLPAVAQPVSGEPGGAATYEIAITEFQQQLHRDLPDTTVWGLNGTYPGPTIEATTDEPITVEWINDLRDETGTLRTEHYLPVDTCPHGPNMEGNNPRTVIHVHGGHIPADSDGYPEGTFLPGESVIYNYPNKQPPATIWYHDHALGITRLNVYMGIAGFYLLRDDVEAALDLPSGEFEIPLVVQDRSFNADGSLRYPVEWVDHFFGHKLLVNGKVWPYLEVKGGKYRFRLLNGSGTRSYTLALSNGVPFMQIGTDLGLLPAPVEVTEVTLSPGERADVIVDFTAYQPGTEIILTNSRPAAIPAPEVMKFVVIDEAGDTDPIPSELRPVEMIDENDATQEREFILRRGDDDCTGTAWFINGLLWDDITEYPTLGEAEIWSFVNRSGIVHPMHMHLVAFQVLDRQDFDIVDDVVVPIGSPVPPDPNEQGWKDTVRAEPQQITRVIAIFEDYAGKYAYHCHILEHEDHEMMRQFVSVPACPGDLDGSGEIGFVDLTGLLAAWGPSCPDEHWVPCPADLDGDRMVGFTDLTTMLGAWGGCAPPPMP